jgi:hypothetical protein
MVMVILGKLEIDKERRIKYPSLSDGLTNVGATQGL